MSHPTDIVFALVGDVSLSSRALRQLRWLAAEGFAVEALTFGEAGREAVADGVHLRLIDRPPGSGPGFFWRAHRAFRAAALERPARVYHASDLYTLPGLASAAALHRGRLVYDSRELYPYVDATAGKPWARLAWSLLERRYIRRCDTVLTVNDSIASRLRNTYGIEPPPEVVHNVPMPVSTPGPSLRERLPIPPGRRIVLYQGLFRAGRGLELLIEAMTHVAGADLVLIGDGPLRRDLLLAGAEHLGPRAHFLPFTAPDQLQGFTRSADVGVCILEPITESVRLALPNKLFEYLSGDLPVVVSDLPEMAAIVRRFDVGVVVPHDDVGRLAAAITRALDDAEARARWRSNIPDVFEEFNPEADRNRFIDVYRSLLG